jgi:hypothetical protein
MNSLDWSIIFFPLPSLFILSAASKRFPQLNPGIIAVSVLLGCILAVPLIATIGICFHFAFGGSI